jgi:hypothetical protein
MAVGVVRIRGVGMIVLKYIMNVRMAVFPPDRRFVGVGMVPVIVVMPVLMFKMLVYMGMPVPLKGPKPGAPAISPGPGRSPRR